MKNYLSGRGSITAIVISAGTGTIAFASVFVLGVASALLGLSGAIAFIGGGVVGLARFSGLVRRA